MEITLYDCQKLHEYLGIEVIIQDGKITIQQKLPLEVIEKAEILGFILNFDNEGNVIGIFRYRKKANVFEEVICFTKALRGILLTIIDTISNVLRDLSSIVEDHNKILNCEIKSWRRRCLKGKKRLRKKYRKRILQVLMEESK